MTADDLKDALEALYPDQSLRAQTAALGEALGRDQRTVLRWYYGEKPVPDYVAPAIEGLKRQV